MKMSQISTVPGSLVTQTRAILCYENVIVAKKQIAAFSNTICVNTDVFPALVVSRYDNGIYCVTRTNLSWMRQ